jgi:hypothetical protein
MHILFFALAGLAEAIMDTVQFHYGKSIFSKFDPYFWDPSISWKNKYKDGKPEAGPRFQGSTTFFVGLTDGWHLAKLCRNLFLFIGIFFLAYTYCDLWSVVLHVILCRLIYGIGFTVFYKLFEI